MDGEASDADGSGPTAQSADSTQAVIENLQLRMSQIERRISWILSALFHGTGWLGVIALGFGLVLPFVDRTGEGEALSFTLFTAIAEIPSKWDRYPGQGETLSFLLGVFAAWTVLSAVLTTVFLVYDNVKVLRRTVKVVLIIQAVGCFGALFVLLSLSGLLPFGSELSLLPPALISIVIGTTSGLAALRFQPKSVMTDI